MSKILFKISLLSLLALASTVLTDRAQAQENPSVEAVPTDPAAPSSGSEAAPGSLNPDPVPPAELPDIPTTFPEPVTPQTELPPDAIPPDALELTEPDPLLPALVVDRPLSPQEQSVLDAALDELQQQALAAYQSGDLLGALQTWNREIRLRRFLGPAEEVASLRRVGEVAWRENQVTEVRLITQRLQQIEQEILAQTPIDYDLLLEIAQGYQTLRARDQAVALYNTLLTQARQEQKPAQERQILVALGDLHLGWFDYPNAAATYTQLLEFARAQADPQTEIDALTQLSRVYQESNQPQQAIDAQQQLVERYQAQGNIEQITALKQAIGDEYVAIGRPDLAATSYQEAFAIARSAQQYAYAGDALQRLANLYVSLERLDDALLVYQLMLDVKQQSYDTLGIMNTYDQIGQIYRALGQTSEAIGAFRRGLQLAQQLNYKVSYFDTQIQQLQGQ